MDSAKLIKYYYLSMPVFLVLDLLFAAKFKVYLPAEYADFYYPYLLVSFILGGFIFKGTIAASIFAILESAFCLLLLILSIWIPTVTRAHNPDLVNGVNFEAGQMAKFLLCTVVLLFGFYMNPLIDKHENA